MKEIVIEKNIPVTKRYKNGEILEALRKMKAGNSFIIPIVKRNSIGQTVRRLVEDPKFRGFQYTSRKISDTEVRVWRLA